MDSDHLNLYDKLIFPCDATGMPAPYTGSWLSSYIHRQFDPTKRSATDLGYHCEGMKIFGYTLPFPFVWDVWKNEDLQEKLSADDAFAELRAEDDCPLSGSRGRASTWRGGMF
jgi:hypothetical protein